MTNDGLDVITSKKNKADSFHIPIYWTMTDDNPLLLHSTQEKSSELTEDELETDSSSSRYGRGVHLQDKQALECMEEGIKIQRLNSIPTSLCNFESITKVRVLHSTHEKSNELTEDVPGLLHESVSQVYKKWIVRTNYSRAALLQLDRLWCVASVLYAYYFCTCERRTLTDLRGYFLTCSHSRTKSLFLHIQDGSRAGPRAILFMIYEWSMMNGGPRAILFMTYEWSMMNQERRMMNGDCLLRNTELKRGINVF